MYVWFGKENSGMNLKFSAEQYEGNVMEPLIQPQSFQNWLKLSMIEKENVLNTTNFLSLPY